MASRSRTVTAWSSSESKSTVTQERVALDQVERYLNDKLGPL